MDGLGAISEFCPLSNMETLKNVLTMAMIQSHLCLKKIFMNVRWKIDWLPGRRGRLEAERIITCLGQCQLRVILSFMCQCNTKMELSGILLDLLVESCSAHPYVAFLSLRAHWGDSTSS